MSNFRNRISGFFYGRYGSDEYNYFLLCLLLVVALFRFIFNSNTIVATVLTIAQLLLIIYIFFRMLSKNVVIRRLENQRFLKIWNFVKIFIKLQFNRIKNINKLRYRRCNHCHAILQLPIKRGKHTVRCPKCGEKINVRILF